MDLPSIEEKQIRNLQSCESSNDENRIASFKHSRSGYGRIRRAVSRAMINSSSVQTTKAFNLESAPEIRPSLPTVREFAVKSNLRPHQSMLAAIFSRTAGEFSPVPPLKITASAPPTTAK